MFALCSLSIISLPDSYHSGLIPCFTECTRYFRLSVGQEKNFRLGYLGHSLRLGTTELASMLCDQKVFTCHLSAKITIFLVKHWPKRRDLHWKELCTCVMWCIICTYVATVTHVKKLQCDMKFAIFPPLQIIDIYVLLSSALVKIIFDVIGSHVKILCIQQVPKLHCETVYTVSQNGTQLQRMTHLYLLIPL